MPDIIIIAALTREHVIGNGLDIPWRNMELYTNGSLPEYLKLDEKGRLPEDYRADMRRFRELTTGNSNNAVFMGRSTYFGKPFANRRNIVVSRTMQQQEGILVVPSIDAAIEAAQDCDEIYCIGGGQIYEATLPKANRMELTWIHHPFEGDVLFPAFDDQGWEREDDLRDLVTFSTYRKK